MPKKLQNYQQGGKTGRQPPAESGHRARQSVSPGKTVAAKKVPGKRAPSAGYAQAKPAEGALTHKNWGAQAAPAPKKRSRTSPKAADSGASEAQQQLMEQAQLIAVDEGHAGQRLDNFLLNHLKGVPKTYVYRVIRSGEVRVNKGRASAQTRVDAGDMVRVPPVRRALRPQVPAAPAREFPVLYEDGGLLVVNKPAGTAVHGGSGVNFGVIEQLRQARPQCKMLELVHRLDRDTSGILAVAKKRSMLTALQDQFRQRETGKTYLALVKGVWGEGATGSKQKAVVIDVPLHKYLTPEGERRVRVTGKDDPQGKRSVSIVNVVRVFDGFTLLAVTIKTGRTHQIRVHLAHMGHPIVGDDKYGDFELNRVMAKERRFTRMFLHAYQLSFVHPQSSQTMQLQAPLPLECQTLLQELENESNISTAV
ncbi:Ribosomal large subunit pseudouridine synthase C [Saezia sanguinis]|uniref:Ribosomal large subunit pseudouridine synthase C n=2 Tax=Saezia sanguinis TaxID=1965230 RepID=A0A433SFV7_9BURK|nr:Ribosomal large subunit pseudouridine synthase C [Saezia sanguinis]